MLFRSLSELVRPRPNANVVAFLEREAELWISAITLHELSFGAEHTKDARRKAQLIAWIEGIRAQYAGRILPVEEGQAMAGGRLRALSIIFGRGDDPIDSLIAAAAVSEGLIVVTRNTQDFVDFGIEVINPWNSQGEK